MIPGEIRVKNARLTLNAGRPTKRITATNQGDRPIQVGSHFHFFEVNRALAFDRASAWGYRLDIPSGAAVRFEAGESKTVQLVAIAGRRRVLGLNRLTEGEINDTTLEAALRKAALGNFLDTVLDTEAKEQKS
ncbi:MAG: urease subunit beta [Candidatus Accumulibacter sp.]|jgi:urease beta subunit|nr:urease subunit beta [Accumulibacter sp.]